MVVGQVIVRRAAQQLVGTESVHPQANGSEKAPEPCPLFPKLMLPRNLLSFNIQRGTRSDP